MCSDLLAMRPSECGGLISPPKIVFFAVFFCIFVTVWASRDAQPLFCFFSPFTVLYISHIPYFIEVLPDPQGFEGHVWSPGAFCANDLKIILRIDLKREFVQRTHLPSNAFVSIVTAVCLCYIWGCSIWRKTTLSSTRGRSWSTSR